LTEYEKIQKYNKNFPRLAPPLTPLKKAVALLLLEKHGVKIQETWKNAPVENTEQVVATLHLKRGKNDHISGANDKIAVWRSELVGKPVNTSTFVHTSGENLADADADADADVHNNPKDALIAANTAIEEARSMLTKIKEAAAAEKPVATTTTTTTAAAAAAAKCAQLLANHNRNVAMHVLDAISYYPQKIFEKESILQDNNEIETLKAIADEGISKLGPVDNQYMVYALRAKAQFLGDSNKNNYAVKAVKEEKPQTPFNDLCEIVNARKYKDAMKKQDRDTDIQVPIPTIDGTQYNVAAFYVAVGDWWHSLKATPKTDTNTAALAFTLVKTTFTALNIQGTNIPAVDGITNNNSNVFNTQIQAVDKHVDSLIQSTRITYTIIASAFDYNSRLLDQLSTELMVKAQPDPIVTVTMGGTEEDGGIITANMLI
jgi:hypothetical protein